MRYRDLGNTGLNVSEIGFGAWGIGGGAVDSPAYGLTDDQESMLALRRAFDLGINFYDTSDFYGSGHSERLIGATFRDVRHQVVIATKVGLLNADGAQDFSPENIERSLDASLTRLKTEYVDLYHLHSPSIDLLEEDQGVLATLDRLQTKGKVRAIGISVRTPEDGITAITRFGLKAVEVNYSLVDQRASENGLLSLCRREDAGFIARTPLCFGFLTGEYSPESEFGETDHRSRWSSPQLNRWSSAHQMFSAALGVNCEDTPAQTALRFCLSDPAVTSAIPGMLTSSEVEENARASDLGPLSEQELWEMSKIYQTNTFFVAS